MLEDQALGVCICARMFCRGFNIKLNTDARVLILDHVGHLLISEAVQMAGRASRTQGVQHCYVATLSKQIGGNLPMRNILTARYNNLKKVDPIMIRVLSIAIAAFKPAEQTRVYEWAEKRLQVSRNSL